MSDPSEELRIEDAINETCPWSGHPISDSALTKYRDAVVGFCDAECRDRFEIAVHHFEAALQAKLRLEERGRQDHRG